MIDILLYILIKMMVSERLVEEKPVACKMLLFFC